MPNVGAMISSGLNSNNFQNTDNMEKKTKATKTHKPANCGYTVLATVDYSKKENQIGCGYCYHEEDCTDREPTVNKAKKGCKRFRHYSEHFQ